MSRYLFLSNVFLWLLFTFSIAKAQPEPDAAPMQQVTVSATRDPDIKTYRAFVAGIDAFEKDRTLAPAANLRFILTSKNGRRDLQNITLRIHGENGDYPVKIESDGTFSLDRNQAAWDDAADMVTNRRKGSVRWRPDVHSPDVPVGMRRLGDLRAECAVRWAVERDELPVFARTVFSAAGGPCVSSLIKVPYQAPHVVTKVILTSSSRRVILPNSRILDRGEYYAPPLHDRSWPDATLIEFE
jgi:hypothetical protein